jgi:broad specificity phosphatase PhoE
MTPHTRIYLIRHGQVAGFDQPRYNGLTDVALTDYGVEQYHCLKDRLADLVNYRVPGGENLLDVEARVMPVINEVVDRHQGQEVLVIGHGK